MLRVELLIVNWPVVGVVEATAEGVDHRRTRWTFGSLSYSCQGSADSEQLEASHCLHGRLVVISMVEIEDFGGPWQLVFYPEDQPLTVRSAYCQNVDPKLVEGVLCLVVSLKQLPLQSVSTESA